MGEVHEGNFDMLTGENATVVVNFELELSDAEVEALSKIYPNLRVVQSPKKFGDLVEEINQIRRKRKKDRVLARQIRALINQLRPSIMQPKPGQVIVVYDQINGGVLVPMVHMELGIMVLGITRNHIGGRNGKE